MPYKDRAKKNECQRKWYRKNRKKHIGWVRRRDRAYLPILYAVIEGLKRRPCSDCGQRFHPAAMDFDHVRGKKRMDICRLRKHKVSLKTVLSEISKCDLVCSNCHRIRTYNRRLRKESAAVS